MTTAGSIERAVAQAYLDRAVDNVTREFPHMPLHMVEGPGEVMPHRARHPAFYGSFDWHSSVHQHWAIVRLLRRWPDLERRDDAHGVLDRHLSGEALATELEYLRSRPGFERPYGQAWLVRLHAEVGVLATEGGIEGADRWVDALTPCRDHVVGTLGGWLDKLTYPIRHGLHSNSAFAMLLCWHAASVASDDALREVVAHHARRFYVDDRDAPVRFEPSGEDFLSPALVEAHLMAEVLDPDEFLAWSDAFLPGLVGGGDLGNLEVVPVVADPTDYRIGHLVGLMLTRAWDWRAIADALPVDDAGRSRAEAAATAHLEAGLPMVLTSGYGGDHWLSTFALLAADGR
jgi:hypothetical protein